jgi:hypothetical protein
MGEGLGNPAAPVVSRSPVPGKKGSAVRVWVPLGLGLFCGRSESRRRAVDPSAVCALAARRLSRRRLRSRKLWVLASSKNHGLGVRSVGPSPGKPRVLSNRRVDQTVSTAAKDSCASSESTHKGIVPGWE